MNSMLGIFNMYIRTSVEENVDADGSKIPKLDAGENL